jgi:hypothetical protein
VRDYYLAAERDGTDSSNPPKPPTAEIAMDASAAVAKITGLILATTRRPVGSPAGSRPQTLNSQQRS